MTPERVANHHAERVAAAIEAQGRRVESALVVDAFAGCGGNAIAFAKRGFQVIGVEMDAKRAAMCRHNSAVYGHQIYGRIEVIQDDVIRLASTGRFKADAVFLSPPWGGPSYKKDRKPSSSSLSSSSSSSSSSSPSSGDSCYDLEMVCPPYGLQRVIDAMIAIAPKIIIFFLPRTTSTKEVGEMIESRFRALAPSIQTSLEMEYTYMDNWLVALSVYCGQDFKVTASQPLQAPPALESKARMHYSSAAFPSEPQD